jgi:hypothetical protein
VENKNSVCRAASASVRGRESDIYGDKMLIPDVDRALETPSLSANTTMNSPPPPPPTTPTPAPLSLAACELRAREMLFVFPRGGGCIMHEGKQFCNKCKFTHAARTRFMGCSFLHAQLLLQLIMRSAGRIFPMCLREE